VVEENYKADFFIFSKKWNWVSQGQGFSILLSVYLFFSTTPAESNLFEKERGREGDTERGRGRTRGKLRERNGAKGVNKLLLVKKILY